MSNAIRCYRPDGTCYAIIAPTEWAALRKAGRLDTELKRRRETGVVIEVAPLPRSAAVAHFKPRDHEPVVLLEWSALRYPCNDPEQGPARRNPVKGCTQCGDCEADSYTAEGLCNTCADPVEHESYCPALEAPENPCSCDADGKMFADDGDAAERAAVESDREAGLVP